MESCILVYPGRSNVASHLHASRSYPVGRSNRLADDWDPIRDQHQRTLNGTRPTSLKTSLLETAVQNWPCVDNVSCEIQLSLVEQQQKLLNQKKSTTAPATKLPSSSNAGLRNGYSNRPGHTVLNSLDNRPLDISHQRNSTSTAAHSKPQQDFTHGSDLHRGVGSRYGLHGAADSNRNQRANTAVAASKPADAAARAVTAGRRHVEECEFDTSEEKARKKLKRLQHPEGSRKSSKLYHVY